MYLLVPGQDAYFPGTPADLRLKPQLPRPLKIRRRLLPIVVNAVQNAPAKVGQRIIICPALNGTV